MRKRIIVILSLLWLISLTCLYVKRELRGSADTFAMLHAYCTDQDRLYVIEPRNGSDFIYTLDASGKVLDLVKTDSFLDNASFLKIASYQGDLYTFVQIAGDVKEAPNDCVYYVVKLDSDLHPVSYSAPLYIDNSYTPSTITVNESGIYLSFIDFRYAQSAQAYRVGFDSLLDYEAFAESREAFRKLSENEAAVLKPDYATQSEDGRFFVAVSYDGKNFQARLDDGTNGEMFKPDIRIINLFDHKSMTLGQRIRIHSGGSHFWLIAFIVGEILIFIAMAALKNRNRLVYITTIVEVVLALICCAWVVSVHSVRVSSHTKEYEEFAKLELENLQDRIGDFGSYDFDAEDFYDSDQYINMQESFRAFTLASGNSWIFFDMMMIDKVTGMVKASLTGHNGESIAHLYSPEILNAVRNLNGPGMWSNVDFVLAGENFGAIMVTDLGKMDPEYALVAISNRGYVYEEEPDFLKTEIMEAMIVFVVAGFLCAFVLWTQSNDLRMLARALKAMAKGATEVTKPEYLAEDTEDMWNCLAEIGQNIRRINRTKYLMLEAYYRFAPKKIETILGRDSITEVESGESISMSGTVAIISSDERKIGAKPEFERMNQLVSMVGKYQDEQKGILIGNDNELSQMKLLFFSDNRHTHDFGIDFIKEFEENSSEEEFPLSILLCFADFAYGIAGTNAQSIPYFVSDEAKQLEAYCVWFRKLGIRLVITADVKNREFYDDAVRYIGYVRLRGTDKVINLYEVLNAYKEQERRSKLDLNAKFQNALQLFHKRDLYLARSAFSEIIKEDRTDGVAKWYLFECERYLNDESNAEFTGSLHL